MRRLYLQIYLTVVGILLLFGVLASATWIVFGEDPRDRRVLDGLGALLGEVLPEGRAPRREVRSALDRLGKRFDAWLTLRGPDGRLLGAVGDPLPPPPRHRRTSGWMRARGSGPAWAIALPDGRWLLARPRPDGRGNRAVGFLMALGLLALAIAIGAYPLVRRVTGRLERLQTRVNALGAGDLSARIEVEGNDEVAALARAFNRAAGRIQQLVEAKKGILASASHELRSPLTRIRMAIELLGTEARPELRQRVVRDINELDDLIEELLLASRVDAATGVEPRETIDLLALVAEEAARYGADVSGIPVSIHGDPRLVRRLIRNLLENARRYGAGSPIEVSVERGPGPRTLVRVMDRGPGVPPEERERIFEPFYRRPGVREGVDKGVGLGLALVRQIALRLGGDARCVPREGGGSAFEVELTAEPEAETTA